MVGGGSAVWRPWRARPAHTAGSTARALHAMALPSFARSHARSWMDAGSAKETESYLSLSPSLYLSLSLYLCKLCEASIYILQFTSFFTHILSFFSFLFFVLSLFFLFLYHAASRPARHGRQWIRGVGAAAGPLHRPRGA